MNLISMTLIRYEFTIKNETFGKTINCFKKIVISKDKYIGVVISIKTSNKYFKS